MAFAAWALPPVAPDLVALAILAGLGIGFLLLGAGSLLPATAGKARPLWPIFLTEVVIVAAGLLPVLAGGLVLDAALFVMAVRITQEATSVALLRWPALSPAPARAAALVAGLLVGVCALALSRLSFLPLVATGLGVMMAAAAVWYAERKRDSLVRLAAEVAVFPLVPLVLFVAAARQDGLAGLLLLAFLLVETYDSYALLGGKLFGRRPAFPRLSPRKTVEGLAAGGIMLALTALALGPFVLGWPPLTALVVAALIAATAIAGDLAASRLKRASGVKDYPQVLPRQGGLLDIADAWLIAGPLLVWLGSLAGPLQG
jgi:phosphatidate cytidylyltransferase